MNRRHVQIAFAKDVKSLTKTIEQMGNPFIENSDDLLVLDSRSIVDSAVADTVQCIERTGFDQYNTYVNERLVDQTTPITDTIKCNNLYLFSQSPVKGKSQKQLQLKSLKQDCSLFLDCTLPLRYTMVTWMSFSSIKINLTPITVTAGCIKNWNKVRFTTLPRRSYSCP